MLSSQKTAKKKLNVDSDPTQQKNPITNMMIQNTRDIDNNEVSTEDSLTIYTGCLALRAQ